jgi:DNA-binding MarR family transcriptional regulator
MASDGARPLTREDFVHLLAFRTSLRRFQRWSEDQAKAAGLTQVQHQLLVAVKGHPDGLPPTVRDLAGYLLLRHHSTVELVDRAEVAGLVRRVADAHDARLVRVRLTARAERILDELTPAHLVELHSLAAVLDELVAGSAVRPAGPDGQPAVIARQAGAADRRGPQPG